MENSLLNTIKSYFTDEVIQQLSTAFGEDKDQVKQGIHVAIPSILLGLQHQDQTGLTGILDKAKGLFGAWGMSSNDNANVDNTQSPDNVALQSGNLINSIFGDKLSSVVNGLTNFLGVKNSSISGLLGASLPAVMSAITNGGQNWDSNAIRSLLNENKSGFLDALPGSLGLTAFGDATGAKADSVVDTLNPLIGKDFQNTPASSKVEEHVPVVPIEKSQVRTEPVHATPPPSQPVYVEEEKKGAGYWWLLIPIILLLLWFVFGKGFKGDSDKVVITDSSANNVVLSDPNAVQTQVPSNDLVTRTQVEVPLSDGRNLRGYASGIEESLVKFLRTDYTTWTDDQLKDKWFDFDNLNFETGTATVVPESQEQLDNLVLILQEFPDAKIKIGGYTDRTGDEALNKRLSQQRADAVKNYIESKGLLGRVTGAEGYGSEFATVDAGATDEERARDRRVAVSVRK